MDLAVCHYFAMRGIFTPSMRLCSTRDKLERTTCIVLTFLRKRYGELDAEDVPHAISRHWPCIERLIKKHKHA